MSHLNFATMCYNALILCEKDSPAYRTLDCMYEPCMQADINVHKTWGFCPQAYESAGVIFQDVFNTLLSHVENGFDPKSDPDLAAHITLILEMLVLRFDKPSKNVRNSYIGGLLQRLNKQ